MQHAFKDKATD